MLGLEARRRAHVGPPAHGLAGVAIDARPRFGRIFDLARNRDRRRLRPGGRRVSRHRIFPSVFPGPKTYGSLFSELLNPRSLACWRRGVTANARLEQRGPGIRDRQIGKGRHGSGEVSSLGAAGAPRAAAPHAARRPGLWPWKARRLRARARRPRLFRTQTRSRPGSRSVSACGFALYPVGTRMGNIPETPARLPSCRSNSPRVRGQAESTGRRRRHSRKAPSSPTATREKSCSRSLSPPAQAAARRSRRTPYGWSASESACPRRGASGSISPPARRRPRPRPLCSPHRPPLGRSCRSAGRSVSLSSAG